MLLELYEAMFEGWGAPETIFILLIIISALTMLYSLALMNNKLRLLEDEFQNIKKDITLLNDELEMLARAHQNTP